MAVGQTVWADNRQTQTAASREALPASPITTCGASTDSADQCQQPSVTSPWLLDSKPVMGDYSTDVSGLVAALCTAPDTG